MLSLCFYFILFYFILFFHSYTGLRALIYLFIYLFLAMLGLRFCAKAFSSCGERGPLFIAVRRPLTIVASHYRGLSCGGAQAPDAQAQ